MFFNLSHHNQALFHCRIDLHKVCPAVENTPPRDESYRCGDTNERRQSMKGWPRRAKSCKIIALVPLAISLGSLVDDLHCLQVAHGGRLRGAQITTRLNRNSER
jgi:hypothetical protein